VTAPSQLLAPDAGTNFLLLCVQPTKSIHLKLDLRPTCSATHIQRAIIGAWNLDDAI